MDLEAARKRGREAARKIKASGKLNPEGGIDVMLKGYVRQWDDMHELSLEGNAEAERQEAFLNGFLDGFKWQRLARKIRCLLRTWRPTA